MFHHNIKPGRSKILYKSLSLCIIITLTREVEDWVRASDRQWVTRWLPGNGLVRWVNHTVVPQWVNRKIDRCKKGMMNWWSSFYANKYFIVSQIFVPQHRSVTSIHQTVHREAGDWEIASEGRWMSSTRDATHSGGSKSFQSLKPFEVSIYFQSKCVF